MDDEELFQRIFEGDFSALLDPALPLHLLADPKAWWWEEGSYECAEGICSSLVRRLPRADSALAIEAWARAQGVRDMSALATGVQNMLSENISSGIDATLRSVVGEQRAHNPHWLAAALSLARSLRTSLDSVPLELDAALAALERYAAPP